MKLLVFVVLGILVWKMLFNRWPWEGKPRSDTVLDRARALLGVGADADRAEILAAHRAVIARVHPDRGGSSEAVHEADAARDVLLNDAGRRGLDSILPLRRNRFGAAADPGGPGTGVGIGSGADTSVGAGSGAGFGAGSGAGGDAGSHGGV